MIIEKEWLDDKTAYSPYQIDEVISRIWHKARYTHSGKVKYLNLPISFDTETTSFYNEHDEKTAIMYV